MRITFFIAFVLSLLCSNPIWADVVNFKHFSINIPNTWSYSEEGDMVSVAAKDNSSILVFSPDKLPQGQNLKEFAAAFSKTYNGTTPSANGAGTFQFEYKNDVGAEAHVIISQADPKMDSIFLLVIVGEKHPELPYILNSVTMTD
ncbi:hypothetical protein C4J81_05375 [Deltaproteobacteria bacterium Smac51]|nr:hypothetical protein C4J81_05375 [Deltaproteobacteria bacterium Smac51]